MPQLRPHSDQFTRNSPSNRKTAARRQFIRGTGIGLALPLLASKSTEAASKSARDDDPRLAKRFVASGTYLGFHQQAFFPSAVGPDYQLPKLLAPLSPLKESLSLFSGLDHRGRNGHEGWKAWLSGTATGGLSVDQRIALQVGDKTRFDSLQLTCGSPPSGGKISFTPDGIALPMIGRPSVLFQKLFSSDSDQARMSYVLSTNASVIDGVLEEANSLKRQISQQDRVKIDEYLSSVRGVEKSIQKQKKWLTEPVVVPDYDLPAFDPIAPALSLECERVIYDLMALALQSDSTRVISFLIPGWSQVFTIEGRQLTAGYHGLSHHGNDPAKIAEYNLVGREHVKRFAEFVKKLSDIRDEFDRPLLDSTVALFGSGMGDSNTHDNSNLPTLLVGGPMAHGTYHRFAAKDNRRLGDLFLSILSCFGIQENKFAGASHNLNERLL